MMNVPAVLQFQTRPWEKEETSSIEVLIPSWTEGLGFTVREKTEIKVGDLIRAVVKNPLTGENLSESKETRVPY